MPRVALFDMDRTLVRKNTAGLYVQYQREIGEASRQPGVELATAWAHRVLPDLASFNLSIEAVHGLPVAASDLWLPLAYGASYCVVVLVLAVVIFERRDFR